MTISILTIMGMVRLPRLIRPEEFLPADFPVLKVNCLSAIRLCLIVYLVIIRFRISTN